MADDLEIPEVPDLLHTSSSGPATGVASTFRDLESSPVSFTSSSSGSLGLDTDKSAITDSRDPFRDDSERPRLPIYKDAPIVKGDYTGFSGSKPVTPEITFNADQRTKIATSVAGGISDIVKSGFQSFGPNKSPLDAKNTALKVTNTRSGSGFSVPTPVIFGGAILIGAYLLMGRSGRGSK